LFSVGFPDKKSLEVSLSDLMEDDSSSFSSSSSDSSAMVVVGASALAGDQIWQQILDRHDFEANLPVHGMFTVCLIPLFPFITYWWVLTSAHFWRIDRPLFLLSCDICVFDIS
jgi:hypothetical protein